jgi:S-DNA-T family DNA segregation ATPase FtsK/SpoIIIE
MNPHTDMSQLLERAEEVRNVVVFPTLPADTEPAGSGPAAEESAPEVVDAEQVDDQAAKQDSEPVIPPGGPAFRRELLPIVPAWLKDRDQFTATVGWAWRYCHHTARYHAIRVPLYALRLTAATPRGAGRALTAWYRWVFDVESRALRQAMLDAADSSAYLQLSRQRDDRVRLRLKVSATTAWLFALGVGLVWLAYPEIMHTVLLWAVVVAVVVLGFLGRREDKPIIGVAILGQQASKLTPDVVVRAFTAAGLCKEDNPIVFAQPIQRDGRGWLAVVDMPYGRHFSEAAKKRDALASGLNANPVTVFLDPEPTASNRRVRLWVSDVDVFAQKPVVSPLAKLEVFDFWQPIPFGVDARDRLVVLPLIWSGLLIGAIPRMGKTFSARIPAAAAALDPYVELVVFNGKPDGAWSAFEKVAVAYGAGVREAVVELLVATLRRLVKEMDDRFERMAKLPVDVCPEAKLTPAISRNKRLRMPLTLIAIDEVQRYLEHPDYGAEILTLLTDLAKVGPAAGYMLVLATQKPDSKVIPDSLRGQLGTRFAMKVMTYQASETILGAGTFTAGMDASKLLRSHKGVGILLGADDSELSEHGGQTVRSHLLSSAALNDICDRGRALREKAGTLTGMAAGEIPMVEQSGSVLDDTAAALSATAAGEAGAHTEVVLARLAEIRPEFYDGWTPSTLAGALKPYGVEPTQLWATAQDGKKRNRQGYKRDHVIDAQARRIDNTS